MAASNPPGPPARPPPRPAPRPGGVATGTRTRETGERHDRGGG